jgi:hypothetical protein
LLLQCVAADREVVAGCADGITPRVEQEDAAVVERDLVTTAVDNRIEHRPDRVARGEDGLLVAERRKIDRTARFEGLDGGIPCSMERDPAAVGDSAEELPRVDVAVAPKKRIDVQREVRTPVHCRQKVIDGGPRGAAQAHGGPLDPVVR